MVLNKRKPFEMTYRTIDYVCTFLSAITILSCLILKVPQINHVRQTQSGEGLYVRAMLMEMISYTTVTLYNFTSHYSLMTYMEYPIILVQIYVLLYYTLKYTNMLNTAETVVGLTLYIFFVFSFLVNLFPQNLLLYALPFCTPISSIAKVTYILGMIKQQNADAISLATWYISVGTNLSRLFTVFVDSKDLTLMLNFIISASLSSGVLITAMYYKGTTGVPTFSDIKEFGHYIMSCIMYLIRGAEKPSQQVDKDSVYTRAPSYPDDTDISYIRGLRRHNDRDNYIRQHPRHKESDNSVSSSTIYS